MIRLVVIALVALLALVLLARLVRSIKGANIDWTGLTAAAAFVVLAFYLRHVTGMG
jgi:ABC-type Co2+ transport system permease subunit